MTCTRRIAFFAEKEATDMKISAGIPNYVSGIEKSYSQVLLQQFGSLLEGLGISRLSQSTSQIGVMFDMDSEVNVEFFPDAPSGVRAVGKALSRPLAVLMLGLGATRISLEDPTEEEMESLSSLWSGEPPQKAAGTEQDPADETAGASSEPEGIEVKL